MNALEEQIANLPPRLTAAEHNAFPQGRWSGESNIEHPTSNGAGAHGVTRPTIVLLPDETMELQFCEQRIEHGLETFLEVGVALSLIRDKRLYRATHETFDAYCVERWEIKSSRARQLCAAAAVIGNLKSAVGGQRPEILPTSERQVRPLMSLPPEQQQTVWREAVATAPAGKVTSKHVAEIARKITGRTSPRPAPQRGVGVIDAGTRSERLKAITERTIADFRELLDVAGTPDSEAASDLIVALGKVETFQEHLTRMEQLQGARP